LDPSLKFTVEVGGKSLKFLDLLISLSNGELTTTVYSKPTDGHLYLNSDSCHPRTTKLAVQHGTALRLKRICSSETEFNEKSKDYKAYLVSCGHKPKDVVESFKKVESIPRNEARKRHPPMQTEMKKHRFFTNYNPHHPNIYKIIEKHQDILRTSATLSKIFPSGSFQVVNKREKNLKELVARADPYTPKITCDASYTTCGKKCDSCKTFAGELTHFKSNATGRTFQVRKNMNCNTPNVIYLAECKKCKKQGTGSTTNWKPRLRNYKSWVKNKLRKCRIGNHFIDNDSCRGSEPTPWANMKFSIIDCLDNFEQFTPEQIDDELLRKEKMWIMKLVTYHHGLNSSHDLNRTKRCDQENFE
jgi:hypothetical protein